MCLVAFQKMFRKIFSNVWLCSWKYHRKHIFYLLLTFSHIFSVTKRIHNIIHSSKHEQNLEKNHQIQTNEGEIAITRSVDRDRDQSFAQLWSRSTLRAMRRSRSRSTPIGAMPVITRWCLGHSLIGVWFADRCLVRRCDRRLDRSLSLATFVRWVCFVVFCSLSVFLSFARATENVWR